MVTDTKHDPVQKEYGSLASKYDRKWADYVEATIRETLRRMPLSPGDRILDVACGTGALLRVVAASDIRVTLAGVDATPEMLEVANSRIGSLADLRHGRAESLPFKDEAFDTVVTTNALHFFRPPENALREMWRVIKPGGRVVVTDWCDDFVACRICDRALRVFSPAHHRIYDTRGCRKLLQDAGFVSINIERYKITWLWGLMTATASKTKSGRPAFPLRRSVVSPCDCPTPRPSRGETRRNLRLTGLLRPVRETVNTGGGVFRRPLGRRRTPNKTSKFARRRPICGTPCRNASRPCGL